MRRTVTTIEFDALSLVGARWKPLKKFAAALDRPVGGTTVEEFIGEDRDR